MRRLELEKEEEYEKRNPYAKKEKKKIKKFKDNCQVLEVGDNAGEEEINAELRDIRKE